MVNYGTTELFGAYGHAREADFVMAIERWIDPRASELKSIGETQGLKSLTKRWRAKLGASSFRRPPKMRRQGR